MTVVWLIVPGVIAAAIAYALTPVARAIALRVGAIDQPSPRKVHRVPTPRLGGLAVIVTTAIVLTAVAALTPRLRVLREDLLLPVAIGVLPILLSSLIDDIRGMRALPRLILHFAGAATTVALGVRLGESVHLFSHEIHIGWAAIPISIIWLAGITNAFNIVDGLDGLSAGLALISSISLAAVSVVSQHWELASVAIVLAGAITGFLPWNIYPARVYLGDTGATVIGFLLGVLTLRGGSTTSSGLAVLLPVFVVGVPIVETLLSMIRRFVRRLGGAAGGIMEADRNHMHHRLLALGLNQQRAVLVLYGVGLLGAACALISLSLDQQNAALLLLTLLAGAIFGIVKLGYDEFAVIRSGAVLRMYEGPVLRSGLFVVFFDVALITTAIYAAIVLKYDDWGVHDHRQLALYLLALAPAVTVTTFGLLGIYKQSWSQANIDDLAKSSAAAAISVGVTLLITRFAQSVDAPFTFFATYGILAVGLVNGSRASYRVLHHWNRRSNVSGEPVLIYGAGKAGALAVREMLANDEVGMRPIGVIDDDSQKRGRILNGFPVMGDLADLENIVMDRKASGVVVASEKIPIANIRQARRMCERNGVWLTFFEVSFRRPEFEQGNELPFMR